MQEPCVGGSPFPDVLDRRRGGRERGRLSQIFGEGTGAAILAVSVQALIFGSVHFQWGLGGMIVTVLMGLIWGFAYLLCGRNLWIVIIAHSCGHILFVIQLYLQEPVIL